MIIKNVVTASPLISAQFAVCHRPVHSPNIHPRYRVLLKAMLLCACGILFGGGPIHSQDQRIIDSLQAALKNKQGAARFPLLYELALQNFDAENETALKFIRESQALAWLMGDSLLIVKCIRIQGQILVKLGRITNEIATLQLALEIAKRESFVNEWIMISNILGSVYLFQSRFDKSLEYYFQTFEKAKQQNDSSYVAMSMNNIGIAYYSLKITQRLCLSLKEVLI